MVCRISIFMYECSQKKNKELYILQKKIRH